MPFGLHKSDKQPEHESNPAKEEALEDGQGANTAHAEGSGPSPTSQPQTGGQPQEEDRGAMAFRPTFLDSDTPSERAPAAQPPKGDAFFVSVTRDGGIQTHRFDGSSQAQTFVEQLLEEGVPQEEVTAFSGRQVALRVSHRPVVKLATSQDD
jgi:hypothetical protein